MAEQRFNIGVIGWYGHPNFGDQLLFEILYGWLKEFSDQVRVIVPWGEKKQIAWPDDVDVGGGWKSLSLCDAFVFGGGGYLGEPAKPAGEEVRKPCEYTIIDKVGMALHLPECMGGGYFGANRYLRAETLRFLKYSLIARAACLRGIPYCIIGTGLGPVTTKLGRWAVGTVLKNAKGAVRLRDKESVDYAREICRGKEIIATTDLVLADCVPLDKDKFQEIKKVGIHLGPRIEKRIEINHLVGAIKNLINDGLEITFIVDSNPSRIDMLSVPERIIQQTGHKIKVVQYAGVNNLSINGILEVLGSLDVVLTSKLHVGIAAYARGAFPVSVAAHIKTIRFYKQIGLEDFHFSLSEDGLKKAVDAIVRIRKAPNLAVEYLAERRETVKQLSLDNKRALESFLKEYVTAD